MGMKRPKTVRSTRSLQQHGCGLRKAVHLISVPPPAPSPRPPPPPEPVQSTQPRLQPRLQEFAFGLMWLCLFQTSVLEPGTEYIFRNNWKISHILPLSPGGESVIFSLSTSFILWVEVKYKCNMAARSPQTSSLINLPQTRNCVFPPLECQHTLSREIWLAWLMIHSRSPSTMGPSPEATTITVYL